MCLLSGFLQRRNYSYSTPQLRSEEQLRPRRLFRLAPGRRRGGSGLSKPPSNATGVRSVKRGGSVLRTNICTGALRSLMNELRLKTEITDYPGVTFNLWEEKHPVRRHNLIAVNEK